MIFTFLFKREDSPILSKIANDGEKTECWMFLS